MGSHSRELAAALMPAAAEVQAVMEAVSLRTVASSIPCCRV